MIARQSAAALVTALLATATPAPATAQPPPSPPRATLYAFFATWCVPCRVELPHIERLHRDYSGRGLRVVLVSQDAPSTAENVPAFLARYGVTAPWQLDSESELLERYNPQASLPFTVVLDGDGRRVFAHAGYEPGDERLLEAAVHRALSHPRAEGEQAPRVRLTATSQGLGVWRTSRFDPVQDNDGRLRAAVGRIEARGRTERYSASVRVDGAFVNDDVAGDDGDARLERAQLSANLGRVKVTAGDDYAQFGHGLTLSLRKVDPLGIDTAIRGARVDASHRGATVTALAGWTNAQNLDPIELRIVEPPKDFITGAELTVPLGARATAGPYALFARANGAGGGGEDARWTLGGAAAQIDLDAVRIAIDAAGGRRRGVAVNDETAWAVYASAQWRRGRVTALVDAKAYRHWELGRADSALLYHEPPTLERDDQEVPGNEDAIGARTRLEVRLPRDTTVFGNALGYRFTQDNTSPQGGDFATHGYLGVDKRFAGGLSTALALGHRRELEDSGNRSLTLWHVDVNGSLEITPNLALTVKWNHREETKFGTFDPLEFRTGLAIAGLSIPGWGALSVLYGYSTERATDPTHYPGAELLVHLPRGGTLRVFGGQLTGGRICVSGSCRDVPPFEGGRLDLVLRL